MEGVVGLASRQRKLPRACVHELQDAAEAEAEEQCTGDRQQRRAQLVRLPFVEHAVDQARGRRVEVVVMNEAVGQRIGPWVQVLLHHEERRQNRHQDVQRQKRRLQRRVDGAVVPPGADRDAGRSGGILPLGPVVTVSRRSLRASRHRPDDVRAVSLARRWVASFAAASASLAHPYGRCATGSSSRCR